MNCKKLLVTSMLLTVSIFCVNSSFAAQPMKAQVSKSYVDINRMIEYNNYETADARLKEILSRNPNDLNAKGLQLVSMAKQYKLAPAQSELDKLLKKYPNNAQLHYAQGLVYLMRQTSSDVEYIKNINNLSNAAIQEFVKAVGIDSTYYQAYNAMGVATLKLGNKKDAQDFFKIRQEKTRLSADTSVDSMPTYKDAFPRKLPEMGKPRGADQKPTMDMGSTIEKWNAILAAKKGKSK